jgi:hypothetical protein
LFESSREKDFIDNVNDTVTRDNILTKGFLLIVGRIVVDVENKVLLRSELSLLENVVGMSDGGFEAVHDIARSKLLGTTSTDAPGLRSLVISSALVCVESAVGLSTSKITDQSGLWKKVEFQKSLRTDSGDQTIDLREGSISRGEDGVGRVAGRHEGLDIIIIINKITKNPEVVTNTRLQVLISRSIIRCCGTGTKITICTSQTHTLAITEVGIVECVTNVFTSSTAVEGDTSLSIDRSGRQEC